MKELKVCWISSGVSSFVSGWLERDTIDKFIYIHIDDQHPDSLRFIKDCEKALGKEIEIMRSNQYNCVKDVWLANRFIVSPSGAKCTQVLKKRVRKKWEYEHQDYKITYVWGFDKDEISRADRVKEAMPEFDHQFPLIDHNYTKENAHAICLKLGIEIPYMYRIGYNNNNCIGCVKGGKGYWNKIRKDFPEVFNERAKTERIIGHSILHDKSGCIFLDELDPNAGWDVKEIVPDCGIACEILDR